MPELKTSRPFQERFLDGFDRSRLRQEVQAVRPRRFRNLKKKYVSWALGASLALGGIGAPVAMIKESRNTSSPSQPQPPGPGNASNTGLVDDLRAAQNIAQQVAGGVKGGVEAAVGGVGSAATAPIRKAAETPQRMAVVTEKVREQFFAKEVPFGSIIYREAKKNNIRPELIAAVVQAESRFKPTARSGAGAVGLMQLVPRTGKWMGARDLTNPAQNIAAGAKYLKYLNERFDGNETKVIAAYNAGEGNVKRFGGVPPFRETRNYVKKVRTYEREFGDRVKSQIADATLTQTPAAGAARMAEGR